MADWAKCFDAAILVQFGKEARQTRPSVAFALSAQALWNRAARPDPSLRKERLLRMTIKPRHHQRCLLLLHSTVLDHRQNRTDHRQADQNSERRFVVSIEETEDMAAVDESQGGLDEVANPAAQHQGCQEFFREYCMAPAAIKNGRNGNGGGNNAGITIAANSQRANVLETWAALFFESLRFITSLPPLRAKAYVM